MSAEFPLARLLDDILVLSFTYLPVSDLAAVAQVSKRFYRLASSNYLWQEKIRQHPIVPLPGGAPAVSNADALNAGLVHYNRWCPPIAIGLRDEELQQVHEAFVAADRDESISTLTFRGKVYQHRPKWIRGRWRKRFCKNQCAAGGFWFDFVVVNGTMATHAIPIHANTSAGDLAQCAAAACVDGIALHVPPLPLPVQPAPEAYSERGFLKLLYRHALVELNELCLLCAQRPRGNFRGALQPFCQHCWGAHELDLFMSAEQARDEFYIEEVELLHLADWCTRQGKTRRAPEVAHKRRREQPATEVRTRFYREFQVMYYAALKWGGTLAIERKRAQAAAGTTKTLQCTPSAARAALFRSTSDAEMTERGKRKRPTLAEDTDYREEAPSGSCAPEARSAQRRRAPQRAAALKRKSYVIHDDSDMVAEATGVFRWGVCV